MPPHLFDIPQEVLVLIFRHFHPVDAIRTKRVSKRLYNAIWTWLPFGFYKRQMQNNFVWVTEFKNTPAYAELCVCNISQIDEALAKCPLDVYVHIEPLLADCAGSLHVYKGQRSYWIVDRTCAVDKNTYANLEMGLLTSLTLSNNEIQSKYATQTLERRVKAVGHMLKTGRVSNSLAIQHVLWANEHLPANIIIQYLDAFLQIPGVCVNAASLVRGHTALHRFCEDHDENEEKLALAQWLLDQGADPTLKTTGQMSFEWGIVPAGATAIDILCLKHPNLRGAAEGEAHPVAKRLYDMLTKAVLDMDKARYIDT